MSEAPDSPTARSESEPPRWWEIELNAEESVSEGSFLLGFLAGLVGGLVVLALVFRRGKPRTRTGVWWGLTVQLLLLAWLRVVHPFAFPAS